MTLLELILSEISEKASARPAERSGQENSSARGQKIFLGCGAKGNFLRPRRQTENFILKMLKSSVTYGKFIDLL